MRSLRSWLAGCSALVLAATGVAASVAPAAHADNPAMADTVFNAWNSAFLYRDGTDTYYTDQLLSKGHERAGTWIGGWTSPSPRTSTSGPTGRPTSSW